MTAVSSAASVASAAPDVRQTQRADPPGTGSAHAKDGFHAMLEALRGRRRRDRASVGVIEGGAILKYQPRPTLWPVRQDAGDTSASPLKPAAKPAAPLPASYVLLVPDVSGGEVWRIQRFDANGFSSHALYSDKERAIEAAISEGFTLRDDTALDRLQQTARWDRGCFVVDLVRQFNSHQITRQQLDQMLADYDDRHAQRVWRQAHPVEPVDVSTAFDTPGPDEPAPSQRNVYQRGG